MPRRVSLPAADDLFRPTVEPSVEQPARTAAAAPAANPAPDPAPEAEPAPTSAEPAVEQPVAEKKVGTRARRPSGRVKHDEKMTVYVTADELLDLEHARLTLRRSHGLAVDRGRLVREAVALVLADLEARGDDSDIVQRLKQA